MSDSLPESCLSYFYDRCHCFDSLFSSRLWDHLASNLEDYIQPQNEVSKLKSHVNQSERNDTHHLDSEPERRKSNHESRSRRNKEWKGLAKDAAELPSLRSSEIEDMHLDVKGHTKISRSRMSPSSISAAQRKRSRPDEQPCAKVFVDNMHSALFLWFQF